MTNSSCVSSVSAIAEELIGILIASAIVLAGIWIATIYHLTGVKDNLIFAAVLVVLPIGGKLVVTVDADHSHAAHKTAIPNVTLTTAANQVSRTRQHVQQTTRSHWITVDIENQQVFGNCQNYFVPPAVVEFFIEIVQNSQWITFGLNLHF